MRQHKTNKMRNKPEIKKDKGSLVTDKEQQLYI